MPWLRPASRSACAGGLRQRVGPPDRHAEPAGRGQLGQFRQGLRERPSGRHSTAEEYALLVGPVFARLFCDRAEVTGEFIDMVVFHWLAAGRHRYDRCEQGE